MSEGFFSCTPSGWEHASEFIPTPWPEECVVADLRWVLDGIKMGRHKAFPTYRWFAARWGWSRRQVGQIVTDAERWAAPKELDRAEAAVLKIRKRAPKSVTGPGQERDSGVTGAGQRGTVESLESGENVTGPGQERDSGVTGAGHTRAIHISTLHPSPTHLAPTGAASTGPTTGRQEVQPCGAGMDPEARDATSPGRDDHGHQQRDPDQQPQDPCRGAGLVPDHMHVGGRRAAPDHEAGGAAGAKGGGGHAAVGDREAVEGARSGSEAVRDPVAEVWAELNQALGTSWDLDRDPSWRKWIREGTKQLGGRGAWTEIARWVSDSKTFDAKKLRERRDPVTLIRKRNRGRYLQLAKQEHGDGPKHNGHLPAERAWTLMLAHCSKYRPPERWHDNPSTEARMREATKAVGGWREIGNVNEFSRGRVQRAWCQAYEEART